MLEILEIIVAMIVTVLVVSLLASALVEVLVSLLKYRFKFQRLGTKALVERLGLSWSEFMALPSIRAISKKRSESSVKKWWDRVLIGSLGDGIKDEEYILPGYIDPTILAEALGSLLTEKAAQKKEKTNGDNTKNVTVTTIREICEQEKIPISTEAATADDGEFDTRASKVLADFISAFQGSRSAAYKRKNRFWLFYAGLFIAVMFNVDVFVLGKHFAENKESRDIWVEQVTPVVENYVNKAAENIVDSADTKPTLPADSTQINAASPPETSGVQKNTADDQVKVEDQIKDYAKLLLAVDSVSKEAELPVGWKFRDKEFLKYIEDTTALASLGNKICSDCFQTEIELRDMGIHLSEECKKAQKEDIAKYKAGFLALIPEGNCEDDHCQAVVANARKKWFPSIEERSFKELNFDNGTNLFLKFIAFLVIAALVTPGAQFWWDVLRKLTPTIKRS